MTLLYKTGRNMYLLAIAELAVYSFVKGDLAMTRPPALPATLQDANPAMAYISGVMLLIAVLAFYLNRYRAASLLTIANIIFWLITTRHLFNLWRDHVNGFKTLWLISGALLILTAVGAFQKYSRKALWLNFVILFLFFVDCGIVHFQFAEFIPALFPSFIPFPLFFTYFAAVCLILGGVGMLIPRIQKLATLLSGIQIAGWFILLHVPRALTIGGDEWIGVGESLAVSGICFMLYSIVKDGQTPTRI
jgi:hypothetical protein